MTSRGFRGRKSEQMVINPVLRYWAPFMGEASRIGDFLYNSEHRKVKNDNEQLEIECREMSEERLLETLFESKAKEVKSLARKLGISEKGSKLDIINRIKTGLGRNNVRFNKIFRKMIGFSDGW